MYVGSDFSNVDVGESINMAFDFVNDLAAGDTIVSVAWSSYVAAESANPDPNAANLPTGAPGISGTVVSQRFSGWVGGVTYTLVAAATTLQGDTLKLWAHVFCDVPN